LNQGLYAILLLQLVHMTESHIDSLNHLAFVFAVLDNLQVLVVPGFLDTREHWNPLQRTRKWYEPRQRESR
jgi:hypothetical protein